MGYKKGDEGTDWFAVAIEMDTAMAEIAAAGNKTIILENPPNTTSAVCTAPECLEALQTVNSPAVQLNFDPGNFGAHGEVGIDLFVLLKDYIVNVHVKDIRIPGDKTTYCVAGEGACEYPEIFKRLCEMNYSGCITAEPHLLHSEQFHVSGRENYIEAVNGIIQLVEAAGFEIEKSREKVPTYALRAMVDRQSSEEARPRSADRNLTGGTYETDVRR